MPDELFDPYQSWLGLTTENRPPNHYELLGLSDFEGDPQIISVAAERQASILRMVTGEQANRAQKLLKDIGQARDCLLNKDLKQAYDEELRSQKLKGSDVPPAIPAIATDSTGGILEDVDDSGPAGIAIQPEDRSQVMQDRIESQRAKEKQDRNVKIVFDRLLWASCAVCVVAIGWVMTVRINGCNEDPTTAVKKEGTQPDADINSQKIEPQKKLNRNAITPLNPSSKRSLLSPGNRGGNSNQKSEQTDAIKETISFWGFQQRLAKNDILPGLAPIRLEKIEWSKSDGGGKLRLSKQSRITIENETAFDNIEKLTLLSRFKTNEKKRSQVLFSLKQALVVSLEAGAIGVESEGASITTGQDSNVVDGKWHSLAISFGKKCKVWLDGQFIDEFKMSLPDFSQYENPSQIGRGNGDTGSEFVGEFDRIGLYWIELKDSQIEAEFAR